MYGWENIISLHMTKTILFVSSFCKYRKTTTKKKIKNTFYFSVNNKNLTENPNSPHTQTSSTRNKTRNTV